MSTGRLWEPMDRTFLKTVEAPQARGAPKLGCASYTFNISMNASCGRFTVPKDFNHRSAIALRLGAA